MRRVEWFYASTQSVGLPNSSNYDACNMRMIVGLTDFWRFDRSSSGTQSAGSIGRLSMTSDSILLTVAIPTYDRPVELHKCVEHLAAQTDMRFNLLIVDNASPVPADRVLEDLVSTFPGANISIVRNKANVGGDSNILRCFELCNTEYVWVLGDDDIPLPNAIETVYSTLKENPEILFVNFTCELYERSREYQARTLDEFLDTVDSFSNVLFLSNSIFHRKRVIGHLPAAYHFSFAMAPHVVLVLKALMDGPGMCLLSARQIVHWALPPDGGRWSVATQLLGQGALLDLPLSPDNRKRLARILPRPRALEALTIQLLGYQMESGDSDAPPYIMDQVYLRLLRHSATLSQRIRFWVYRRILLRVPSIGLGLFKAAIRMTGRGEELLTVRLPFHRG